MIRINSFVFWMILIFCGCAKTQSPVTKIDESGFAISFDSLKIVFIANIDSLGSRELDKYRIYDHSGQLIQEVKYRGNGRVRIIGNYDKGVQHGRQYTFSDSGLILGEFEFIEGVFTGLGREFDSNGKRVFIHSKINPNDSFGLAIPKD